MRSRRICKGWARSSSLPRSQRIAAGSHDRINKKGEHRVAQPDQRPQPTFRRIVTNHDADGKPMIWIDGNATNHKSPDPRISSTLMWSPDPPPTHILGDEDEGNRILVSAPPIGG